MKKNVLLVEDDSIFNFINNKTIGLMGFAGETKTALNGREALEIFSQYIEKKSAFLPDIVFLDLDMPILDGYGFIEGFNKLNFAGKEKVVLVVLTSSEFKPDIDRVKALGVKHFMPKPISADAVKGILDQEFPA